MNHTTDDPNLICPACAQVVAPPHASSAHGGGIQVTVHPVAATAIRSGTWEAGIQFDSPGWSADGEIIIALSGFKGSTPIDALSRLLVILVRDTNWAWTPEQAERCTDAILTAIGNYSASEQFTDDIHDFDRHVVQDDGTVVRLNWLTNQRAETGATASPNGLLAPWKNADELAEFFAIVSPEQGTTP